MKKLLFLFTLSLLLVSMALGQVNISAGDTVTQDFSIGTSATATLPSGWRADKNTTVRSVGSYGSAVTATERSGGNSMSTTAANGIYNFGANDDSDRAIGGLSSASDSKSVNLYVQLYNNGSSGITNFTISYNVEKYRNGSNSAGFSIQMYYSTNGSSWTSAGSDFLTSFSADANNNGYASAPGATVSVSNKTLSQALAASSSLYLAWNYSVTSGTTTSNAQALGVDDISITANGGAPSPLISVIGTLSPFSTTTGTASASQSYSVSGSNLTANISITAPSGFEVSTSAISGYQQSISLTQSGGSVASTTVYARLKGASAGNFSGNIAHESTGATTVNLSASGTVTDPTPIVTVNPSTLSGFTYVVDEGPSTHQTFTVSGSTLTADITVTASTNYEISKDGTTYTSSITLTQTGGSVDNTTIYVRLKAGLASGDYIADQNVTASSGEASASVSLSGRVIELFDIPYSNDFRSLTDNNIASLQGFVISNAQNETGSGGYLRIFNGGYIETPSIDFADHDYLYVKFSSTTYGGATSQVLSLKLTIDNGITYDVLETYPITTEYINYSALVDISGIASNGMLKIEMTGGTNSTRFRDFSISVANATESQLIPTGHAVQTPPFGSTGVSLLLSSVTTSGSIEVSFFEDAPVEVSFEDGQAPLNYSTYRWTIDGGSVVFSNGHLRIETAGLPGVSDPNFLDIYHRSSAGSGVFTKLETVNANGVLSAPISSFSEFILGNREGGDNTLPVELSTFTVALNNYNNAVLTWVTQTETGVSGFYVFRNTEESLATAEMVSNLIPATNTSQQQVYLFTDKELGGPGTYYYWLQVSDMDGSDSFYGPITLVYQGGNEPGIPSIPQVTELKSIYPNPFNPSTTISYGLAEAADVKVQIFNSRGQLVRSISEGQRNAGNYNLIWNGTDNNGQSQPTGVYFVRLHAGKKVFNSKAVLMK